MSQQRNVTQFQPPQSTSVESNIKSVAEIERHFEEQRNLFDRIADTVARFSGSIGFVILHLLWFTTWFLINTGLIPGISKFDPYPFIFLSMTVSVEAVLLSTFVLMKQNRMQHKSDQRDQLNLQIDMLAEKEITKILQVLLVVCHRMGISEMELDKELIEMVRTTSVDHLARQIKREMSSSG